MADYKNLKQPPVSADIRGNAYGAVMGRSCICFSEPNKWKRYVWCLSQVCNEETFDNVIWTDESKIELDRTAQRTFQKDGHVVLRPKPKHPFSVRKHFILVSSR